MDSILSSKMNFLYMVLALYLVITSAYIAFAVKDEKTKLKYRPMHVANFALTLLFIISPLLVEPIYAQKENIIFIIIPLVIILISLGVNIFRKNFKSAISKEKNIAILALVNSLILILLVIAVLLKILLKRRAPIQPSQTASDLQPSQTASDLQPSHTSTPSQTATDLQPSLASQTAMKTISADSTPDITSCSHGITSCFDNYRDKFSLKLLSCARECFESIEEKFLHPSHTRDVRKAELAKIFTENLKKSLGQGFEISTDMIRLDPELYYKVKDMLLNSQNIHKMNNEEIVMAYYDYYLPFHAENYNKKGHVQTDLYELMRTFKTKPNPNTI